MRRDHVGPRRPSPRQRIDDFVRRYWSVLQAGRKIEVAADEIEHPAARRDLFVVPPAAWPVGQSCDYVWRLDGGGRVHAQCFTRDGRGMIRFHVDRWDPDRSPGDAILHAIRETPLGPVLGVAAVLALVVGGIAGLVALIGRSET